MEILGPEELRHLPPVEHPVVQVHPATGRKNLFVGRHASHILGEDFAESRALLERLTEEGAQPPRLWKHRWIAASCTAATAGRTTRRAPWCGPRWRVITRTIPG